MHGRHLPDLRDVHPWNGVHRRGDPAPQLRRLPDGADRHLGPRLVRHDVGSPAAGEGADVERGLAEHGVGRERQVPQARQDVDQLVDRRVPQLRVGGVGRPPLGREGEIEIPLRAQGEPVLGGLAVDQVAGPPGVAVGHLGADAVRLLADDEQQAEPADPLVQQLPGGLEHGGDPPLGVARPPAVEEFAVFRGGEERRHGVHVGREDDHRLPPGGEDVEAVPLDRHALDRAAGSPVHELLQMAEKEVADLPLPPGRRVDVDQGAGQLEEVHGGRAPQGRRHNSLGLQPQVGEARRIFSPERAQAAFRGLPASLRDLDKNRESGPTWG